MAQLPGGRALPGKLFLAGGIGSSGRTSQPNLCQQWLLIQGYRVA